MDAAEVIRRLRAPGGNSDPYPLYAQARRSGAVLRGKSEAGGDYHLVTSFAAADAILRDPAFGVVTRYGYADAAGARADRPIPDASILRANPPDHRRMRSAMSPAFQAARIETLRAMVEASVDELLESMARRGATAEFMEDFAYQLPLMVICALLGIPDGHRQRFRELAGAVTATLEPAPAQAEIDGAGKAQEEVFSVLGPLTEARRRAPDTDLISALAAAEQDGVMTRGEVLVNLSLLLVAGFETTAHLLGNGLALLFSHPEVRRGLEADLSLIPRFLAEVLRYDAPVQLATRTALASGASAAGVEIRPGSLVLIMLGSAGRDPDRFADPDRFLPLTRDPEPHLAFGSGLHYCLGAHLARLEAEIAFERLLTRFPVIGPAAGASRRSGRMAIRGFETLPVDGL